LCACQNGTVTLSVADAPIDGASEVTIRFTGVDLVDTSGSTHSFEFDQPVTPNFASSSVATPMLTNVTVPAGDYSKITLHISADGNTTNSFVTYLSTSPINSGQTLPMALLDTTTDAVDVLKTFQVTRLRNTALTADIDLRKSIQNPANTGDPLVLDPQVRLVDNDEVGTLTGTVAASLVASGARCSPGAIYVYSPTTTTPGDEGGSTSQPFTSTTLPSGGSGSGFVSYTVGFLPPGTYTVALICNPEQDDLSTSDTLDVFGRQDVSISAGLTTTALSFGP
jgi:hypothetical protein